MCSGYVRCAYNVYVGVRKNRAFIKCFVIEAA